MNRFLPHITSFIFAFLLISTQVRAQTDTSDFFKTKEDTLMGIAMIVSNDTLEQKELRYVANKDFIKTLVSTLKQKNSFDYPFDRLYNVSIAYPQDSTFRVFSWQVKIDTGAYHYYGAIQMNQEDLKLIPLIDRSDAISNFDNDILNPENWYGAIYYSVMKSPKSDSYLLFGYETKDVYIRRKLIDVLTFSRKGVEFGKPIFEHRKPTGETYYNSRMKVDYSFDAPVSLNYNMLYDMIIFEHLIQIPGRYPGQKVDLVPDGSYQGYKWLKGKWVFVDKIFHQVQDEPPSPAPVFDN